MAEKQEGVMKKSYKVREGSIADKAVRFGHFVDKHDKLSFTVAMALFWGIIYAAILSTYPV